MPDQLTQSLANDPQVLALLGQLPQAQQAPMLAILAQVTQRNAPAAAAGSRRRHRTEDALMGRERTRLWNNYYSVVRFQATVSSAPPVSTITFTAGTTLRPFSYRIGDNLTTAGFDATFGNATDADTNLTKAGETLAGELLKIHGLSLMNSGVTDIEVWKQLVANISVAMTMNGDAQRYKLGRIDMIPASGGTFGTGPTTAIPPTLPSAIDQSSAFSNGYPVIDNYYPFPQPMIWSPSGETDSNFNVVLTLVRTQVFTETARVAAAGVQAFTPPTAAGQFGSFIDVMARLHCEQISDRSVNQ